MVSTLETRVAGYCRQEMLFRKKDRVIVGVSGGADSVCLLRILIDLSDMLQISLVAVHINHGLRENAPIDAAYVEKICSEWNVPFKEYCFDVEAIASEKKMSIEEAGRFARYDVFDDAMKSYHANKIALAHHMDDQVETILWNLFRGTGAKGLAGMAAKRDTIVRPLLCVSKEEIISFLKERGIEWCTDETNEQSIYTRNKLRNQLIPTIEEQYNKQGRQHIVCAGTIIAQMEDYIAKQGQKAVKQCVRHISQRSLVIRGKAYRKEEPILREYILKEAICEMAGTQKDIGQIHVQMLKDLMENQVSREIALPYGLTAVKTYDGICIRKSKTETMPQARGAVNEELLKRFTFRLREMDGSKDWLKYTKEKRYTKCFDYDIINNSLSARTRRPGDSIVIDDKGNSQKLKYYFINEKIPRELRDSIVLLTAADDVLWVVGYRISEKYKITEETKRVLQVTYHR